MRPLVWIGIVLMLAGVVVLAMQGVSYTKARHEVAVGPVSFATVEKGFVPPVAGIAAIAVGVILVFVGRQRRA
jgi:uncharacterized membrane protein